MPYFEWTEAPECPHCGAEYSDPWELDLPDGGKTEVQCEHCEGCFQVEARVTSEYSTVPWSALDQARADLRSFRVYELYWRKLCGAAKNWDGMIAANDRTLAAERRVAELEGKQ